MQTVPIPVLINDRSYILGYPTILNIRSEHVPSHVVFYYVVFYACVCYASPFFVV